MNLWKCKKNILHHKLPIWSAKT